MKYLMVQYRDEHTSDKYAKYSIVECANEYQKNLYMENASTDGINPDYRVEMKRVRRNSLHDLFSPNKEYQPQEVRNILAEHGRKSVLMYWNVYGWESYLTTRPTFATPTGELKGFPRRCRIKCQTNKTRNNENNRRTRKCSESETNHKQIKHYGNI